MVIVLSVFILWWPIHRFCEYMVEGVVVPYGFWCENLYCYVISICCDLYVFCGEWNVRGVNVE